MSNQQTSQLTSEEWEKLRALGGGDIPVTQAPMQKTTDPKVHYTRCGILTAVGLAVLGLGIAGALGVAYLHAVSPLLILVSTFLFFPGLVGLYRGPGEPAIHVIPRPKLRHAVDYAATAGGAAGPA